MTDNENANIRIDSANADVQGLAKEINKAPLNWDFIVLTASNEAQARRYEAQLSYRRVCGEIPQETSVAVISDPDGKRIGSGGATLSVLCKVAELLKSKKRDAEAGAELREEIFDGVRILCIHSGGDSKRIPQYSVCGKIFSPYPRMKRDGFASTLFDEVLNSVSSVPEKLLNGGMLVCSGDVLVSFNGEKLPTLNEGALAISVKESAVKGSRHGVYLPDGCGGVKAFLHKKSVAELDSFGAIDVEGSVAIDTGAVLLDSGIVNSLYSLVDAENARDELINEKTALSFYADFSYPLASSSTVEGYLAEAAEGGITPQLLGARKKIWKALRGYRMRLFVADDGAFIHFGTTAELLAFMNEARGKGKLLNAFSSDKGGKSYSQLNSLIEEAADIGADAYLEDSCVLSGAEIGDGCVISSVTVPNGAVIPKNTVLHGLRLKDGRYSVRIYAVNDDPKKSLWFGLDVGEPLWGAKLFSAYATEQEAVLEALKLQDEFVSKGIRPQNAEFSLSDAACTADKKLLSGASEQLTADIIVRGCLEAIRQRKPQAEIINEIIFNGARKAEPELNSADAAIPLMTAVLTGLKRLSEGLALNSDFSLRLRVSSLLDAVNCKVNGFYGEAVSETVKDAIVNNSPDLPRISPPKSESITVSLPLRVNFGGGWTDTPPYCLENGGSVLNAAIKLGTELPVTVTVRRVKERKIILESTDVGCYREFYGERLAELSEFCDPSDDFALHKAAMTVCGLLPFGSSGGKTVGLTDIEARFSQLFATIGGGLYLNTAVNGVPKGSGLGTSSILSAACIKALFDFFRVSYTLDEISKRVLCMEQIMSTGGGWQDQLGGLTPGIKLITASAGLKQEPECEILQLSQNCCRELESRFALIYTGQRRLARRLLREIMGKYVASEQQACSALRRIGELSIQMKERLLEDDIDGFAKCMNEHWHYSRMLDESCTNSGIEEIFDAVTPLICGRMICGAGGGGYLQVILNKGVSFEQLAALLNEKYGDNGICAQKISFLF